MTSNETHEYRHDAFIIKDDIYNENRCQIEVLLCRDYSVVACPPDGVSRVSKHELIKNERTFWMILNVMLYYFYWFYGWKISALQDLSIFHMRDEVRKK